MPLVGTLARSSLFHTLAGRNLNTGVPDSGAIPNLSQLRVSPLLTHAMSSNILEDCSPPQMGNCAHSPISTQPSGEVSGQGWGECRVRLSLAALSQRAIRGDRSRGTHNRATDSPQYTDGRDKVIQYRLPPVSTAAHFRCILAGGTPFFQPTEMGGTHSSGSTWPARHSLSPVFQTAGVKSGFQHPLRTRGTRPRAGPPLPAPPAAEKVAASTIRQKIRI